MSLADSDYLGLIGKSFSVPEKSAMKLSLLVLGEKLHSKTAVWGKVMGISADYLIAMTVPDVATAPRLYYYSIDGGSNWSLLPTQGLTKEQIALAEELRGRFFGVPDFQYKVQKDVPAEANEKSLVPPAEGDLAAGGEGAEDEGEDEDDLGDEEDEEQQEEGEEGGDEEDEEMDDDELRRLKNKPKFQILKMSEAVRLAHFVVSHDAACRLVVRGAFVLNEKTNTMVRNRTFEGIDVAQASKLRSFFKVSSFPADDEGVAEQNSKKAAADAENAEAAEVAAAAAIEGEPAVVLRTAEEKRTAISENNRKWFGPTYSYSTDYLQPIAEDQPNGVWAVKYDASLPAVSVQNLLYSGSLFYYVPDSTTYGQFYYGTGERNLDLCFQLPCQ